LVVQGLTLPAVIRALHLPGDPEDDLARERAEAKAEASRAINAAVEKAIVDGAIGEQDAARMRAWVSMRDWRRLTERLDRGADADRRLEQIVQWSRDLVRIERDVFITMRNEGRLSEEVLREVQYGLDLEEALLERRVDDATGHLDQLRSDRKDAANRIGPNEPE
jgi:hypothetical protein